MIRNVLECFGHARESVAMLVGFIADAMRYLGLCLRPIPALAAENLFLRQQLVLLATHNGTNLDKPWPASGTPVVANVQPLGFSPVTEEALTTIVQRLVPALQPDKIIVFGSYIYGAPTPDSDLDLLVIMDTQARPVDRYQSVSSLLRPRPFPLDILVKTPEEIEQACAQGDSFIDEITTQGRVLYERAE